MILENLELRDFRSYEKVSIDFDEKTNLIIGRNGQGKTNIVEALYYLSIGRSWRTDSDTPLIRMGCQNSNVRARIREGEKITDLEVRISKDGKKVLINGKNIHRLSELYKVLNVLLFIPEDTTFWKGSPSERRSFLDVSISKKDEAYLSSLGTYKHLLSERNALLKEENVDLLHLDVLTSQMLDVSKPILEKRANYLSALEETLTKLTERLFGSKRQIKLVYRPFLPLDDKFLIEGKNAYKKCLEIDLARKSTSIGLHREDFRLLLDAKDVGLYCSQGENRLTAIALKLSPYFLIGENDKKPIVVLDDVYSELDETYANNLSELLKELGQTFITSVNTELADASYIEVSDHKAYRRSQYGK